MTREITELDREHYINKIADEYLLRGENNPTKIAKALGIPRRDVLMYIEEWRSAAIQGDAKTRADELLREMDRAYDKIIQELWLAHDDAENVRDKNTTLKNIAEVIAKRQDVLQRAGLYDDAAMGDQLAVAEEQIEGIKTLLKAVAEKYPETRQFIISELGRIFHEAPPMEVDRQVNA